MGPSETPRMNIALELGPSGPGQLQPANSRRRNPGGEFPLSNGEPTPPGPSEPGRKANPAGLATEGERDGSRPGAGAGLRWAIALFLAGALLVLLFGGPSPPG